MPWMLGTSGFPFGFQPIQGEFANITIFMMIFEKIMVNAYGSEERQSVLLERTHLQPDWKKGQVTTRSQKR
jgi:hypothetical protein